MQMESVQEHGSEVLSADIDPDAWELVEALTLQHVPYNIAGEGPQSSASACEATHSFSATDLHGSCASPRHTGYEALALVWH
jgi:hypothetical protein